MLDWARGSECLVGSKKGVASVVGDITFHQTGQQCTTRQFIANTEGVSTLLFDILDKRV